ncbi:probable E3 ubiquitin-protein ligase XERICO [Durio zibethinus]|uniref:Probable E3 ubiquitin-protein ligase XERICO n=1 Tax=Durio zibethinus TaxID=66656 RepID=A0A6P6BEX5_DURZI|nr:probable E3 ubiquitin-protein ligase XERICO [Durio zibethinus]
MGLLNFPTAAEGVFPVLVMNRVLSVALLKNMVRSLLQVVDAAGCSISSSNFDIEESDGYPEEMSNARERRISITEFKSLCHNRYTLSCEGSAAAAGACYITSSSSGSGGGSGSGSGWANMTLDCCVCLCGFEAHEEVSELSCKHFFHKGCLEKWFSSKHSTCPLCDLFTRMREA